MIDSIFNILYDGLNASFVIAILASVGWGILSVLLSPCHLSSIPLIVGYITSQGNVNKKKSFLISLLFSTGILVTIAAIGLITASIGKMLGDIGNFGNYIVAVLFVIVGLYLLEVINLDWKRLDFSKFYSNVFISALVLGLLFGLALGPCTFAYMAPVLGVVFQISSDEFLKAVLLLLSFGVGHCLVIVIAGTLTGTIQKYLNWSDKTSALTIIKKICGVLVIIGGIYIFYLTL